MATRERDVKRRAKDSVSKILREQKARELDFRRITLLPAEIDHARSVVAAGARERYGRSECDDAVHLMRHLGLMPDQNGWYYSEPDPHTPRRQDV